MKNLRGWISIEAEFPIAVFLSYFRHDISIIHPSITIYAVYIYRIRHRTRMDFELCSRNRGRYCRSSVTSSIYFVARAFAIEAVRIAEAESPENRSIDLATVLRRAVIGEDEDDDDDDEDGYDRSILFSRYELGKYNGVSIVRTSEHKRVASPSSLPAINGFTAERMQLRKKFVLSIEF